MQKKADEKAVPATAEQALRQAAQTTAEAGTAPARKRSRKIAAKAAGKRAKKAAAGAGNAAASAAPGVEISAAREAEERQEAQFGKAVQLFQNRKFGLARIRFERVVDGPNVGLSHRAGVYLRICEEQSARARPRLKTVEEFYNYAVQLINDGRLKEAETYLKKALRIDRNAAHVLYALSVLKVLTGDAHGAFEALRKSIRIDPQNRILARKDPDLTAVSRREPFRSLLAV